MFLNTFGIASVIIRLLKENHLGFQCKAPKTSAPASSRSLVQEPLFPLAFSRWGKRRDLQFQKSLVLVLKDGLPHEGVGEVG